MVALAWAGRLNPGGYSNVLMPMCAALALCFGLALHTVLTLTDSISSPTRETLRAVVYLACILQLVALNYSFSDQIPKARDLQAGRNLVSRLAAIKGDIFVPYHSYLCEVAGKPGHAHWIALLELKGEYGGDFTDEWRSVEGELLDAMKSQRFKGILLDRDLRGEPALAQALERYYVPAGPVFTDPATFWPMTGWRVRPETLYVPRGSSRPLLNFGR
jgi:hypothetical protein